MSAFSKICVGVPWSKVIVIWLAIAATSRTAAAQDHYCGVYSAYAVLHHYGRQVNFEELLKPEYVPEYSGSTARGIVAALNKNGVDAKSHSGLGVFDLQVATGPIILHVRGSQGTRQYNHWVVYLGEQHGQAIVLDPSRGHGLVSYSRLLAMWKGIAVATAQTFPELAVWRAMGLGKRWLLLVACGCLIFPLTLFVERSGGLNDFRSKWFRTAIAGGVLIFCFSATALVMDLLNSDGLIRSPIARASITSVRTHDPFPEIGLQEAVRLHSDYPAVEWVDARYERDYNAGHIPRSVSLPIDATFQQEDDILTQLSKDSEMVVYCQSQGCAYAHAVSERLRGHGFKRIRLFAVGYREWAASGASVEPQRPKLSKSHEARSSHEFGVHGRAG